MLLAAGFHASLSALDYAIVASYVVAMIGVGVWFSRGRQDAEGYLLGGRSIVWWVAGISYLMTLLSTLSMVSVPGEAYNHGVTQSLQNLILPFIAIGGFSLFVRFYFKARMFTPFDYLERRFDARVRGAAAAFYWLERMIYLGLVLYATSVVFQGACGWDKRWTILITGGVAVAYTLLGGLRAVAWTELFQFVILVGGMGILIAKILWVVPGGTVGVIQYAFEHGRGMPQLTDPSFYSPSPFVRLTIWGLVLFVINEQLFFNSADQIAIQRYLSTSSYREARRSMLTYAVLSVPAAFSLWFLGLAIFSFYGLQPPGERPVSGDQALYRFIGTQLPTPLPGLIIAALLAKGMSTLAGGFNSLSTVATVDCYRRFLRPAASEGEQVAFSRVMTIAVGVAAAMMGLALSSMSDQKGTTVMEISFAWLSLWVSLPPVFLLGVLSRRARGSHALTAFVIGAVITAGMIWYFMESQGSRYPLSFMYVGLPGPIVGFLVGFGLSRLAPPRPAELPNLTVWTLRPDAALPGDSEPSVLAETNGAMHASQSAR